MMYPPKRSPKGAVSLELKLSDENVVIMLEYFCLNRNIPTL